MVERNKRNFPLIHYTLPEHLPSHYQAYLDRSPQYYIQRAEKISVNAQSVITGLFSTKKHPEQLYRSCEGILSLAVKYEKSDFDKACILALELNACNYTFLENVLKNGMTKVAKQKTMDFRAGRDPRNVRGKDYYRQMWMKEYTCLKRSETRVFVCR